MVEVNETTGLTDIVFSEHPPDLPGQPHVFHPMVVESELAFSGVIFDVMADTVNLGAAGVVFREFVKHPGAVAIVALDDQERVAVIDQYRHPVRSILWEIPAGLLDVGGEPALAAAQRELAEEADLVADTWHVLVDFLTSPGGSDEALRVYLARDLRPTTTAFHRFDEEAGMEVRWVPLDDLVATVLAGRVQNPSAVVGALAAQAARAANWSTLRPADAHWSHRPNSTPLPSHRPNCAPHSPKSASHPPSVSISPVMDPITGEIDTLGEDG